MSFVYKKIAFVGAGCYGTAIAQSFSKNVGQICLISDSQEIIDSINQDHVSKVLGNAPLNSNISCSGDYSSIKDAELIFITVPVNAVSTVCKQIKQNGINAPVVLCSKGVDVENSRLISEMVEEVLPNDLLVFSGPSFANEVVRGLPFGVNISGKNLDLAGEVAKNFSSDVCRIEAIDDYIGIQVCGAFKNILAIGCGMKRGAALGNNAVVLFLVQGMKEIGELIVAMGGNIDTLMALGGLGDIVLTCTGEQSRNGRFGEFLAKGGTLKGWEGALAEGVFAAKAIPGFSRKYGVKFEVFNEVYEAIYG